jgi:hypothetical protein
MEYKSNGKCLAAQYLREYDYHKDSLIRDREAQVVYPSRNRPTVNGLQLPLVPSTTDAKPNATTSSIISIG